jgi:hypothetical protein
MLLCYKAPKKITIPGLRKENIIQKRGGRREGDTVISESPPK